jgi:hypothetical protein
MLCGSKTIGLLQKFGGFSRSTPEGVTRQTLTFFLLWFGFSQFGLLLHGLSLWKGGNPLQVLSRKG